jgi:hypothetical protein
MGTYARLILSSFPLRIHSVHFIRSPSADDGAFPEAFTAFCRVAEQLVATDTTSSFVVHDDPDHSILGQLEGHGLHRESLPTCIGGEWTFDFGQWVMGRRQNSV